jgi:hypothetical protein
MATILDIPHEVISAFVFNYLHRIEKFRCAFVCKAWLAIIKRDDDINTLDKLLSVPFNTTRDFPHVKWLLDNTYYDMPSIMGKIARRSTRFVLREMFNKLHISMRKYPHSVAEEAARFGNINVLEWVIPNMEYLDYHKITRCAVEGTRPDVLRVLKNQHILKFNKSTAVLCCEPKNRIVLRHVIENLSCCTLVINAAMSYAYERDDRDLLRLLLEYAKEKLWLCNDMIHFSIKGDKSQWFRETVSLGHIRWQFEYIMQRIIDEDAIKCLVWLLHSKYAQIVIPNERRRKMYVERCKEQDRKEMLTLLASDAFLYPFCLV